MSATDQAGTPEWPVRRYHGVAPQRGADDVPHSRFHAGYFGRMFRSLPPLEPKDQDLDELAETMFLPKDARPPGPEGDAAIPAGYTYLGQFIDHDVTFDPTSKLQRTNDPDALHNFRTPRLDLDSVYGSGPTDEPFMYEADGIRLREGKSEDCKPDLPRTTCEKPEDCRAVIGDPRNDENVIVSQIHLAFIQFHNRVIEELKCVDQIPAERLFAEAQRIVRWHYQWIVVHDFLPRIVGREVVDYILGLDDETNSFPVWTLRGRARGSPEEWAACVFEPRLHFYSWRDQPFMPVEFSAAAYRFGHSMIRGRYSLNDETRGDSRIPIFLSEAEKGTCCARDLSGPGQRRCGLTIDWRHFFEFPNATSDDRTRLQRARKIDTHLAAGLDVLPKDRAISTDPALEQVQAVLSKRNLRRGKAVGLPSGQAVARAMGIPDALVLRAPELGLKGNLRNTFEYDTPLWYYILKEAEVWNEGEWLGPVGGRIVAEVLIGLIYGDRFSYLNRDPLWQPTPGRFGARQGWSGDEPIFGMPELLRFPTQSPSDPTRIRSLGTDSRDRRCAPAWARRNALRKETTVADQAYTALQARIPIDRASLVTLIRPLETALDAPNAFLERFVVNNARSVQMYDRLGSFLFYVERVPGNGGCVKLKLGQNPVNRDTAATIYFRAKSAEMSPARDVVFELREGDAALLVNEKFELECLDYSGAQILMAGIAPNVNCGSSPCP